ncbi:MAG TPA: PEGA domain-containing protein [Polyangiaceae bacterium]|jgi:tetratricopeptide (TPR) repeat protein|nr:PEGA domain-containing protein [Polyangiaceae bacterium]
MALNIVRVGSYSFGVALALSVSKSAWAEPQTGSGAAAPPASPSAAPPPSAEVLKEAGERYARGLALYGDGEFLLALVEFERAYQLSNNYKVLYNIGQVRIQLGRYAKAKEALEQYLKAGGSSLSAERTQAVNKDLSTLAERTASLNIVSSEVGADISLDGKVIATSPLTEPLIVDAGEHNLVLHKSGFYDAAQSVTLAGHDQIELKVELKPIPVGAQAKPADTRPPPLPAGKTSRTAMYAAWATTGTLAVTAGVVGYFGVSKANELDSLRTQYGATRDELDKTQKSARTLLIITDVTTGLAIAAGGVALYLTLSRPSEKPATGSVALGIAPNGLRLRGSF